MGNKVNAGSLIITIQGNNKSHHANNNNFPYMFHSGIQFPFYFATNPDNNNIQYVKQAQLIDKHIMNHCVLQYKCSLSKFSTLVIDCVGDKSRNKYNKIWRMISDAQNVQVNVTDFFRIGEVQMYLKYFVSQSNFTRRKDNMSSIGGISDNQNQYSKEQQSRLFQSSTKCRICFQNTNQPIDPLISLCKCEGSVKYIHFQCLKTWVISKIKEIQYPNCTIYEYAPIVCQLCKSELPSHFYHEEQFYSLIQKEELSAPYAIFQLTCQTNTSMRNIRNKTMIRIKLNQGIKIILGRSQQSDIPLRNQSVSRSHSLLFYTHKKLYIKDLKSTYGTYVYTKNANFTFNAENGVTLLIKDSKIKISTRNQSLIKSNILECCKNFQMMQIKIFEDHDQKFTMDTSWDLLDFLE